MNSRFKEEERLRLIALIQEWNLNRIDLFSLSEPNQNLEFFGVMRFYYQDEGEKVSTKCIRVSSTAGASDVIDILVEKFRPDMRMLTRSEYSLYEVHINGDERRLLDHERPLLIQLNWGKDDREGRFLLKKEIERSSSSLGRLSSSASELSTSGSSNFKRKLSKKEKKEQKKKEKEDKMKQLASRGSENEGTGAEPKGVGVAEKLYSELPESSFTRSISNPELVMRKRRQLKLERKLQDMNAPDGAKGGTLKIYGQSIKPDVPYKTLLVSTNDTVAQVVAESLEKYGYESEDPDNFCLVMVMVPPDGNENNKEVRERMMDDDEYPLNIVQQHPISKGDCFLTQNLEMPKSDCIIKFHLRLRPPDAPIRRRQPDHRINKLNFNYSVESNNNNHLQQMSYLVPISHDGRELMNSEKIIVPYGMLEVGRDRTHPSNLPFFSLTAPDILPQHCSLTRSAGGATWITPANHEAATVFIQNQRIHEPTLMSNGQVVQIGRSYFFRYLDNRVPSMIQNSNYATNNNSNVNKYSSNHLRSPSSSSTSTTRPGKDFETTFDLDGQVLTVPSQGPISNKSNNVVYADDVYNKNLYNVGSIQQQQQFKANLRPAENLLPANFILTEGHEDAFLRECVGEVNFAAMQFKMSPSFLVYLCVRSMLRSSSSPLDEEQRINSFSTQMSQLINKSLKENMGNPPLLSFWLANASELKNFFSFDRQLLRCTSPAQTILLEVVQTAFTSFGDCLKGELEQTLPAIVVGSGPEAGEEEVVEDFVIKRLSPKLGNVTHVLTLAMSVLRRCRVNTTITIFIFSQLFHFIGSWVFNSVVLDQSLGLCSSDWGRRLRLRLQQIMIWSEKQGLEKAAECHLAKVMQLCLLLECRKSDLLQVLPKLDLINSIQLHTILTTFMYTQYDPPLSRETLDRAIRVVASTMDYDIVGEGREPVLLEPLNLHFPVARVFPREGFSCDSVVGVPQGMLEFVEGFARMGIGAFSLNPNSSGSWSVYLDRNAQPVEAEDALLPRVPEVIQVTLHKVRNSLGLSIVAAQGEGLRDKGIYIKSVVPSGAADLDGRIETGDQLIEVGGRSLIGVTQERAAEMMSQSGQVVNLKVLKKAAMYHGLSALLGSDSSQQKRTSSIQKNRTKVQDPDLSLLSLTAAKHGVYPDNNNRSQSSLSWKQDESLIPKEDPYIRLPPNLVQPARIHFNHGMQPSLSDPNLINPDDSYLRVHPKVSGAKKFDNGVSSLETFPEPKYGAKNVVDQLRSSSLAQGSSTYHAPSPTMEPYQVKPAYGMPNQNIQIQPVNIGRQDPLYAKFNQGRSNSPMDSIHFLDAPPIKFNPSLPSSKPPRPSSAVMPLGKGPGYATQMLFPKTLSQSQQLPNVRVSPAIFSQNTSIPPSSQNQSFSSISSNTDFLITNANQSSEIYQSRSQIQPKNKLNTSADYDFPPPPPDIQLAQLKISSSASVHPRPFETIQSNTYDSSHSIKTNQSEMHLSSSESSTNQKKPPPVAVKPKIMPTDLKSVTLSKSPWEKEVREKEEEEMMKRKRKDEMRRLENKPYLSQEEQTKLKKLQTEEEFDQRVMQASQENQDVESPTMTFIPHTSYLEHSSNPYMNERQQNQKYGQTRTGQPPFELSRQSPSNFNPLGHGQQEEQPISMQSGSYRSREELQMVHPSKFPQSDISQTSLASQSLSAGMKKTVTFNENVGVNEYPVLRSYGSTSSDGSLVQSYDQTSFSGNYSDDQSPNSTFQRGVSLQPMFLPKLDQDPSMFSSGQVSYEYKPKFTPEPVYAPRPSNPSLHYPYRPPQSNMVMQPRHAPPMTYPYRPPPTVINSQQPITNPPIQGRRALDATYAQRTALQENPYSRNKSSHGNYSYE